MTTPDPSLADLAYRRIEELIVTLDLAPGTRVSEHGLAERIGLGRTPVREALQRLAGDGILITRPRRGMLVREIDLATQLRVLEARRALEVTLVRLAARRRTAGQAERLEGVADAFLAMRGDDDPLPGLRQDRDFIDLLLESAGNPFLGAIVPLYALSRRFWVVHHHRARRFASTEITDYHIHIARAVAGGEERRAAGMVESFLDHIEQFTRFAGTEFSPGYRPYSSEP